MADKSIKESPNKRYTAEELEAEINKMISEIKPQQVVFAYEYCKTNHITNSALTAGYAKSSAHVQGSRLIKHDKVNRLILLIKKQMAYDIQIDAEWVLRELVMQATADRTAMYDEEGNMLPMSKWPESVRRSITGLDTDEIFGAGGVFEGQAKRVRTTDKLKALELIGRHAGVQAFSDSLRLEAGDSLVDALQRGKARARKVKEENQNGE